MHVLWQLHTHVLWLQHMHVDTELPSGRANERPSDRATEASNQKKHTPKCVFWEYTHLDIIVRVHFGDACTMTTIPACTCMYCGRSTCMYDGSVRACTMTTVHACTMAIAHAFTMVTYMQTELPSGRVNERSSDRATEVIKQKNIRQNVCFGNTHIWTS